MEAHEAISSALKAAGRSATIVQRRELSGGCVHRVLLLWLGDGSRLVIKLNRAEKIKLFEEEAHGLKRLAETNTVLVPQPILVHVHEDLALLLITEMETTGSVSSLGWGRFGEELAALHNAPAGARYGFERDNHIGSSFQANSWRDDWVEFNAVNRLGFQLNMASEAGLLDSDESGQTQCVIDQLHRFIPRHPKPSLLHGDLWSGNALPVRGERVAVIDPACSIGDGWADVAMMRLFGGFPEECFEAYARNQVDRDNIEDRLAVYQLYHVLNHVNMFGRGYVGKAMSIVRQLI